MDLEQTYANFQTTEWTILEALHNELHPRRREAADLLMRRYWPPVFCWFRGQGVRHDEAAEATQAFFAEVVVGRGLFERADASRGRLRALLKVALRNFLVDTWRRVENRDAPVMISFDEIASEERAMIAKQPVGEDIFDQRWALAVLEETLDRCEHHYRGAGNDRYWEVFVAWIVRPAITGNERPSREVLADEFGFADAGHVAVAVHAVKSRCRAILRQVVDETASAPADREDEYRRVTAILG